MRHRTTTIALAVTAAASTAHVVLSERRHRERIALTAARIHQRLLADQIERPELRTMWGSLEPLDEAEQTMHLHRNAWVSMWELMHRLGLMPAAEVRSAAESLLTSPEGRAFWKRVREDRMPAAKNRREYRFHTLIDGVYQDMTGELLHAR
ncbi:DUF6082 family protein [Streptomyces sp. DG2A-72]|uniref:DUF6082 family protein n=1 Tax=Streptomyces sp. DG2A-72 TaxID=3051386 RepID=UPI00265B8B2E|nr:DUF6082 family protein [Streptomyces sp. DG2A-72]MDO0936557.1 DUF6082 family protein [Streptomyces sp. DG2A-72]